MTDTPKTTESKAELRAEPKAEMDELEKIMSEIEELQNELEVAGAPVASIAATPVVAEVSTEDTDDILKQIQTSGIADDSNMEETLAELKAEATSTSLLEELDDDEPTEEQSPEGQETRENPMSNAGGNSGNDGTMTMTLTGNMTLKLKYEFEGQEVTISFADQALKVQMTDGTEFKVPVARAAAPASNVKPFKKTG